MKVNFKEIEEGLYKAMICQISEDSGPYGPFLRIVFTITDGELKHYRFSGFIKPSNLKQGKFYRWVVNILGKEPQHEFYTEELIGKECVVSLSKQKRCYAVTEVYEKNTTLLKNHSSNSR